MLVTDLSAGCETLLLVISECDRPCNRRLARARQAAQLEEVSLIWPVHPAVYLVEELDARVGEARACCLAYELKIAPSTWYR
jgi:hypothetical protein